MNRKILVAQASLQAKTGMPVRIVEKDNVIYNEPDLVLMVDDEEVCAPMRPQTMSTFIEGFSAAFVVMATKKRKEVAKSEEKSG